MLPHLIILTDSFPSANGAGISQTLYNLLDGYPGQLAIMVRDDETLPLQDGILQAHTIQYTAGPWRPLKNRLGRFINPLLQRKQLAWQATGNAICYSCLPTAGKSLVLISTTVPHKLHLAWCLLQKGYTVIPYFMDDWLANNTLSWKGGNIQQVAKDLLAAAPAWLMISENLKQVLMKRYGLPEKPCLVIHNPSPEKVDSGELMVDSKEGNDTATPKQTGIHQLPPENNRDTNYQLVYAGSIWPMHADALIAVAKAIHFLQEKGQTQYQLRIHASMQHWQQYKALLEGPGIEYGGWIPYADMQAALQLGWLLLCTASFLPQYQAYSYSSVQTKITDYMAAGRPLLFVGPPDAASGTFVETWDCGFTISTPNPDDIAERLQTIARMPEQYLRKATNAANEAATTFSKAVVQQKLYSFLDHVLPSS